jgi:AcrR family transcriptional regulator
VPLYEVASRTRSPTGSDSKTHAERIVQAAREVFRESGYGAATIEAVASGAGPARSTIIRHFVTKRGLWRDVTEQTSATIVHTGMTRAQGETTWPAFGVLVGRAGPLRRSLCGSISRHLGHRVMAPSGTE